jgi:hypothetical protein
MKARRKSFVERPTYVFPLLSFFGNFYRGLIDFEMCAS